LFSNETNSLFSCFLAVVLLVEQKHSGCAQSNYNPLKCILPDPPHLSAVSAGQIDMVVKII